MFASAPEYWDRFDDVRETLERLLGIGNADPAALKPPPTPAAAVVDAEQFAPLTTAIEGGTQLSRELLAVQREAAGRVGDGVEEMRLVRAEIAALRREMNEHQDTVRRLAGKAA